MELEFGLNKVNETKGELYTLRVIQGNIGLVFVS